MVLLHTQQIVKYFRVAPAAIWAIDYCLTFEHEVHLFTNTGRWGVATIMFVFARYSPIVWIISDVLVTIQQQSVGACLTTNRAAGISLILILVATEGLLLIRTLALWHDNRRMKQLLFAIYLLAVVSMVTCTILAQYPLRSVCVPISTPRSVEDATNVERLIMGIFVSSALFELTAIIVTVHHSMRLRSTGIRTASELSSTLWKGSLLYALSLLAISIANIVTLLLPLSGGQNGVLDVFQGVLHGVLASRIIFDLRAQAAHWDEEHNIQLTPHVDSSDLQFASQMIPLTVLHDELDDI